MEQSVVDQMAHQIDMLWVFVSILAVWCGILTGYIAKINIERTTEEEIREYHRKFHQNRLEHENLDLQLKRVNKKQIKDDQII